MLMILASLTCASGLMIVLSIWMARVGERIAASTGIARGVIGLVLLGTCTSLPELVTSLAATLLHDSPGLAFGNVFGSNVANLAFLLALDLCVVGSMYSLLAPHHVRNAVHCCLLTALAIGGIVLGRGVAPWCSRLISVAIVGAYAVTLSRAFDSAAPTDGPAQVRREAPPWGSFIASAVGIVIVGLWLTRDCDQLAKVSGLGATFIGTLVLAMVTSIPELVVSVESMRLGSPDMALGNILGSNLFNVCILSICDLTYAGPSLFTAREAANALPCAFGGIAMAVVLIFGLRVRPRGVTLVRVSPVSLVLLALYVVSNGITYLR